MRRSALTAAALAACALALASSARAHGDPASDYLLERQVFLPYGLHAPARDVRALDGLAAAANRSGFTIRVAVIGRATDLGPQSALWRRPRAYARLLGEELRSDFYVERLLVVMPNGLGFSWPAHSLGREYAALGDMTVAPGPGGLTRTATLGLQRLLDRSNVRLVGPRVAPSQAQRNRHDRLVIVVVSLGVLAAAVVARFFKRRANASS